MHMARLPFAVQQTSTRIERHCQIQGQTAVKMGRIQPDCTWDQMGAGGPWRGGLHTTLSSTACCLFDPLLCSSQGMEPCSTPVQQMSLICSSTNVSWRQKESMSARHAPLGSKSSLELEQRVNLVFWLISVLSKDNALQNSGRTEKMYPG